MIRSTITASTYIFPKTIQSSAELEAVIAKQSTYTPAPGIIESITGIQSRHVSAADEYNSSLAIVAAEKLFSEQPAISKESIDLLIFASAGQDMLEPATAHVVQEALQTHAPVLDVTNACNSFINALEIADAFIKSDAYKRILIVTGEVSTKSAKLTVADRNDFKNSFPGYTFGDIGTAVIVEAGDDPHSGIIDIQFTADSSHWSAAMLAGGGSRFRDVADSYFTGSGHELKEAFATMAPAFIATFLQKHNLYTSDIQHAFLHQVSLPYLDTFMQGCDLTPAQVEETVSWCGNVAAGSLPLAYSLRAQRSQLQKGDLVLLFGLAGGISLGVALVRI